ncbi:Glyoxalase-like domain-containing protein [Nocardia amikacinitolerans]|uniref:VOC family protein n=1 Tax=Nocardia amikacinitolerans TaxID=756689 RepID=UPI000AF22B47|nr:VOC family protein [Nocardia amikacinitolerans]MCP2315289.1 Glyoxalase-like domain-containing protein [Nocardia amikacinitolerans]
MRSDGTMATEDEVTAASAVGRLRSVVLDCPEPRELARFYAALLGGVIIDEDDEDDTWVVVVDPDGRRLAFQTAPRYKPPRFPDPEASQQIHLDLLVDDIDIAETKALAIGARLVQANDADRFRVYTDPVGHTFCLVWLDGR